MKPTDSFELSDDEILQLKGRDAAFTQMYKGRMTYLAYVSNGSKSILLDVLPAYRDTMEDLESVAWILEHIEDVRITFMSENITERVINLIKR